MTARPSSAPRYGRATIALHWITLLLLAAVYATIELREAFPRGSDPREMLKAWHFMLGLSVFALVWIRLAARRRSRDAAAAPRAVLAGRLVHVLLYLFMIGMPLIGWLILSAEGDPIPFFGMQLPPLIAPNALFAEWLEELHETVGKAGYFLIGLHAAAALFHQYALRDGTLGRMLPRIASPGR